MPDEGISHRPLGIQDIAIDIDNGVPYLKGWGAEGIVLIGLKAAPDSSDIITCWTTNIDTDDRELLHALGNILCNIGEEMLALAERGGTGPT